MTSAECELQVCLSIWLEVNPSRKCSLSTPWQYWVSGLEVYKNTCLCFSTQKHYAIYVFNSAQSNLKHFYARPYTSMWAPVVVRQISKRYSSSCHVFISMWAVISSTAAMIRCLKSARSRTFLLYTTSLINPHAKKSNGFKSGDLGGQAVGPPPPTQCPGTVSSRNVVTSLPTLKCTDVHKNLSELLCTLLKTQIA